MRILHLTNDIQDFGNGIINVAVDLACMQARDGHSVGFASAGGAFEHLLRDHGVHLAYVDQSRRRLHQVPSTILALSHTIRRFSPDIIHAHMMTGAVLARVLGPLGAFHLVTSVHNSWQRGVQLMRVGERVIAVSHAVAREMIGRGFDERRIDVVLNGPIGTPRRPRSTVKDRLTGPVRFLTVAGMYHRKGVADLIRAFRLVVDQCPDAFLHIVGDGPDRREFEHLAKSLMLDKSLRFEGHIVDPSQFYENSHVFVLASHSEPFGLCLVEARVAGAAVIGTRTGGIPEALSDGEGGLLIGVGNIPALAETMIRLALEPDSRSDWSRRALAGLETFTAERMSAATVAVYERALANKA